jgi:hypothetical protein
MTNFIKEQLAIWRLKKLLRRETRMDQAFARSARMRFIELARQRAGALSHVGRSRLWKYATITAVIALTMTSSMAVFADANNVSASHPLYNLKRLSEQVRLDVSSPGQKVELHKAFAQRRLKEASEIEKNGTPDLPATPAPGVRVRIEQLKEDFRTEAETGLDQTQDPQIRTEIRVKFCDDIFDAIQQENLTNRPSAQVVQHIQNRCGRANNVPSRSRGPDKPNKN